MKQGLRNTLAIASFATMSLFSGIKAKADERSEITIPKEKIIEMAKTLEKNNDHNFYMDLASDLLTLQQKIPQFIQDINSKNRHSLSLDTVDHFWIKETSDFRKFIYCGDDGLFFEIKNGKMTETKEDDASIRYERDGATILVDTKQKKFSVEWISNNLRTVTKSPEMSYTQGNTKTKKISPKVQNAVLEKKARM